MPPARMPVKTRDAAKSAADDPQRLLLIKRFT
jgi:hypothetical protein